VPVISWIPEGDSEPVAVPMTERAKEQLKVPGKLHSTCPLLHPPTGRESFDIPPLSADSRARRAVREHAT